VRAVVHFGLVFLVLLLAIFTLLVVKMVRV